MGSRTIYAVLDEAAEAWNDAAALHQPIGDGNYQSYSWNQYRQAVQEVAAGLRCLGISKGDVVALASETRAEFYIADLGIMANGSIAAALYLSYPPGEQVATLQSCGARAVFVEDPKALHSLRFAAGDAYRPQWILLTGEESGVLTLRQLREKGRAEIEADGSFFQRIQGAVKPSDPAILYLTSGATGQPKTVLVSNHALSANVDMGPPVIPLGPQDSALAFLPSAHIAQRVGVELLPIRMGMPVWFSESLIRMPHEFRTIRPTFVLAPPRVWERIYASICTEIRKRGPVTQRLFWGAIGLGNKAAQLRAQGKPVPGWMRRMLALADKSVFQKIRDRFGGRLRYPVSGAAPLGRQLGEFYEAVGMPLIEGYGLTEGGILSLNPHDAPRVGTIGKPLPGVQMKLAPDGELLVSSPTLFLGYHNDPAATAEVLQDGWLHTGDLAEIDAEGYVTITGRKKEMIVLSNGKKVFPSHIESLFKTEPLISQIVVVGDRLPYTAALFTINPAIAEGLKGMDLYAGRTLAEIVKAPPVLAEVKKAVRQANRQLAPFEQIRKWYLLDREFTVANGELTPTMKVRRAKVLDNFKSFIAEMYAGKEDPA